jgi:hypothetical protein
VRRWLNEMREGARILASRDFWRAFGAYWSAAAISARMDDWVHATREATGQAPDLKVEARRRDRLEAHAKEQA